MPEHRAELTWARCACACAPARARRRLLLPRQHVLAGRTAASTAAALPLLLLALPLLVLQRHGHGLQRRGYGRGVNGGRRAGGRACNSGKSIAQGGCSWGGPTPLPATLDTSPAAGLHPRSRGRCTSRSEWLRPAGAARAQGRAVAAKGVKTVAICADVPPPGRAVSCRRC